MNVHRILMTCAVAALTASGGGAAIAQNSPADADPLRHIAPHDRQAYVQRLVEHQAARRSVGVIADTDFNGPVLTVFDAGTTLNLTKAGASLKVKVKATDDLSGVHYCSFTAYGPHNQGLTVYVPSNLPTLNLNVVAGPGNPNRFLEPGTWKFAYGYCADAAYNYTYFNDAQLSALGNTTVNVVSSGYDVQKPTLVGGKVLTGSVSLSSFATGTTTQAPYVGVRLDLADTGDSVVSGILNVYAYFCLVASPNNCLYLYESVTASGIGTASLAAATQVSPAWGHTPGEYVLQGVYIYDYAGNYNQYTSTVFGGSTDFAPLFGGVTPKIKLKP